MILQIRNCTSLKKSLTFIYDKYSLLSPSSADAGEEAQVVVKTINSTSLAISWQRSSSLNESSDGYQVTWWEGSGSRLNNKTSYLSSSIQEFIVGNLEPFVSYIIELAIYDLQRNHAAVVIGHGTGVTDPKPYPPPLGVSTHTAKSHDNTYDLTVKWSPPSGTQHPPIQGYIVEVCCAEDAEKEQEANANCRRVKTSSMTLFVEVDGLEELADYSVEVRAFVENDGRDVEGEASRVSVSTAPPPIPRISDLEVSPLNSTSLNISWIQPSGLGKFNVVCNLTLYQTDDGKKVLHQNVNGTGVILRGLTQWTNYTVEVYVCLVRAARSHCGDGNSVVVQTPPTGRFLS